MLHITAPAFFTNELEQEFQAYSALKYPNEACAFIIEGKLVYVENVHDDPQNHFRLSAQDTLLIAKAQGFIHSHPDGYYSPSKSDMQSQLAASIPFGICSSNATGGLLSVWWGDHTLDIPLVGRPFIHGVLDCYDIVRSVYWQEKKIKLKNYPRDDGWWKKDDDLYSQNFADAGFVSVKDLQKYDVILMQIGNTNVVNHAAVYMGDNFIVHHLTGKNSKMDMLGRWAKFAHNTVRYDG